MKTIEVSIEDLVVNIPRHGKLYCVIDIGATNCRVGLVGRLEASQTIRFVKRKASSLAQLKKVMLAIAASLGEAVCMRIVGSAVDVPGPVQAGASARLSNYGDSPRGEFIRVTDLPKSLCPCGKTVMLNDLEAAASGVLGLHSCGIVHDFFEPLFSPDNAAKATVPHAHTMVVAPGTGLGNALLLWNPIASEHTVLPLEFGHAEFASTEDQDFSTYYRKQINRVPCPDDLCSGRGLAKMHQYITGSSITSDAGVVCEQAAQGNTEALAALRLYFKFLMKYSSNVAMGFQAFKIFLCGDNMVNNKFFLSSSTESVAMRQELLKHGSERMGMMSKVGVTRQSQFLNLNIVGCIYAAAQLSAAQSKL